jgi:hypothetical protein
MAKAPARSKTTPTERERESGLFYGTENFGSEGDINPVVPVDATADELNRESGMLYGSENKGIVPPLQDNSKRQSAYDVLFERFKKFGLEALVTPLKGLIADPTISESDFTNKLRESEIYQNRFAANKARLGKGLRVLDEANYIALEDQYQKVLSNYGLPASYYAKGEYGRQESLEKFIAADTSADELEDRIITAQDRVLNANPEVLSTLKAFYGDSISNGDILAYVLNPERGLKDIQRKVTAAEIGGAAMAQNLTTNAKRAEELAGYGVTKEEAQKKYVDVAEMVPLGSQLADIYNQGGYNQATAEADVFNTAGSAEAKAKKKKLKSLEEASFSGSSGVGALGRDRSGSQTGAGSY